MWAMQAHGALQRGISVLMIDGPGQGGTLQRHKIVSRHDYEIPIGRCIDYLATRTDVDLSRIAVCGSSLGGYYAARAAALNTGWRRAFRTEQSGACPNSLPARARITALPTI